ncbi:MAG: hypothetical protein JO307_24045 [Bryobacterales bacterium]|nr:hypothetical protein [Bryobacterales bacterium]MBV9396910.1 hypothetical protein [Bryobacterales bacterium]
MKNWRNPDKLKLVLLVAALGHGEIVDRIAVVVDRTPVKQSDIFREIRLTALINGEQPDFSLAQQRQAASRLIDQAILRNEIGMGTYPEPDPTQIEQLFQQIRGRYRTEAAFHQSLMNYGLTQEDLMDHLRWEQIVLQFIALRFGNGVETSSVQPDVNQQFFKWLDETRSRSRVLFRDENLK